MWLGQLKQGDLAYVNCSAGALYNFRGVSRQTILLAVPYDCCVLPSILAALPGRTISPGCLKQLMAETGMNVAKGFRRRALRRMLPRAVTRS